jgi:peptide/nickel transport system permease protein
VSGCLRLVARRLISGVLLVVLVSSSGLLLARVAPGDATAELTGSGLPAESIARERVRLGLDEPVLSQYLAWLVRVPALDFGESLRYGRPVAGLVRERARNTAVLAAAALILATLLGVPCGVMAGSAPATWMAGMVRALSLSTVSVPPLLSSLAFVLLAARTGWFPLGGMSSSAGSAAGSGGELAQLLHHLVLPAVALALPVGAAIERLQAHAMTEALCDPSVTAAMARGVPTRRVVWRHALRLAVRPAASAYGFFVAALLSGSFAVEIVMAWPGLGRLTYEALVARDFYLVSGCAAAGTAFLVLGNLISDLALVVADPRLRGDA